VSEVRKITRPLPKHSVSDKPKMRIGWLIWANLLGVGGAVALFFGILYADFLSGGFRATLSFFERHEVLMALTASAPFFATILVGMGYAKRGIAKKRARIAAETAAAQRAEAEARAARGPLTD
jgi:hypothetical protein